MQPPSSSCRPTRVARVGSCRTQLACTGARSPCRINRIKAQSPRLTRAPQLPRDQTCNQTHPPLTSTLQPRSCCTPTRSLRLPTDPGAHVALAIRSRPAKTAANRLSSRHDLAVDLRRSSTSRPHKAGTSQSSKLLSHPESLSSQTLAVSI